MENRELEGIDKLIKRTMKEVSVETPSAEFTERVLNEIEPYGDYYSAVYRPLISKRMWTAGILLGVTALSFVVFSGISSESRWVDFSFISKQNISSNFQMNNLEISNALLYGGVFFGLLFFAQISLLKKHFNERIDMSGM